MVLIFNIPRPRRVVQSILKIIVLDNIHPIHQLFKSDHFDADPLSSKTVRYLSISQAVGVEKAIRVDEETAVIVSSRRAGADQWRLVTEKGPFIPSEDDDEASGLGLGGTRADWQYAVGQNREL